MGSLAVTFLINTAFHYSTKAERWCQLFCTAQCSHPADYWKGGKPLNGYSTEENYYSASSLADQVTGSLVPPHPPSIDSLSIYPRSLILSRGIDDTAALGVDLSQAVEAMMSWHSCSFWCVIHPTNCMSLKWYWEKAPGLGAPPIGWNVQLQGIFLHRWK